MTMGPVLLALVAASASLLAQRTDGALSPAATEVWAPVPRVVAPGRVDAAPPADAFVLFDGRNLDQWISSKDGSPAAWRLADGLLTVDKRAGNIETRRRFRDYQLHLEWRIPEGINGTG